MLQIGQVLLIPPQTPSTGNTYTVQRGDSLYSIAKKFGVSVNDLKTENNLTSNMISIGQVLRIPQITEENPSIGYTEYTVVRGDSLYSIANRFNTTVNELINLNNLTSNLLQIGQILRIPSQTESTPSTPNTTTYTVKPGDSLYSIANRYNTTVNNLKLLNNLTNDILQIGQILIISSNTTPTVTYTVKSGDNLYSIANRYNTTVNQIKILNNLTSNILQIGQTLLIPTN
ncbi:MAG: LysM peptidoglycan-binding domain-containing protein [Bacilli bacterium]|nr:LysM peptidoglycan-binding domain-containing protein [Bacilli bacterium]